MTTEDADERLSTPIAPDPFSAFYDEDYERVVSAVALVAGSRPVARDAVDEALARAWERTQRGRTIDSLAAWCTTVAFNVARRRFRRRAAERRAVELLGGQQVPTDSPERLVERSAIAGEVRRALARLPRRQREVTVLHYFLERSVDEIARELGVHPGTVKTSLHRARAALAEELEDER